ncbi:hypothetical protein F3Y22_tig00110788pilonHSYRG00309 [Hibiscus syriacus]|uniref:HTH myb-type domain-containing protein n=1 Tax=Hibiscus syriacus TaxID=106335 RepID=A0A6A2ZT41_HIBSY|nr:transcription factor HHO5-like [Hibiscus syriacus]KAE8694035.1 hypothetical protein F3Y22_tig00110788pilonHSYRG00309 [Hibiscus syriacus]
MELSLGLSSVYVPKTISEFVEEVSKIEDGFQRSSKISDFVQRLEGEMKKIDGFKRELPLCMLLLKDGIERLKVEEMQCKGMDEGLPSEKNDGGDKKNCPSLLQLSNSDFDNADHKKKKPNIIPELLLMNPGFDLANANPIVKSNGGCTIASSSSITPENPLFNIQTSSQQQQNSRKPRQYWSPDLHRRFVLALEELGGSQAATPKQIKQLMRVDGLTNDEVKSHLQKHRLHVRKLEGSAALKQGIELMQSQSDSPQGPLTSSDDDSMNAENNEKSDGHIEEVGRID